MHNTDRVSARGGIHVSVRRVVDGHAVLRAARLMDMLYKPSEIAEELKIKKRAIYDVLIPLGLPHRRDEKGRIWLHGPAVREWLETATRGPKYKLATDEMFCLRCFAPRAFDKASLTKSGKFVMAQATCPECGAQMYKGVGKRAALALARKGILTEEELEIFEK